MDDGFGCNNNAHHNPLAWALLFCMPEFVAINAFNVFPLLSYKSIARLQYQVTQDTFKGGNVAPAYKSIPSMPVRRIIRMACGSK